MEYGRSGKSLEIVRVIKYLRHTWLAAYEHTHEHPVHHLILVAQHGPLWLARGARGIHDESRVIFFNQNQRFVVGVAGDPGFEVQHAFNGLLRDRDVGLHLREILLDTLHVLHEGLAQDESLRVGMVDDVLDLFRAEAEIEWHSDGADLGQGEVGLQELVAVVEEYGHLGALLDLRGQQGVGELIDAGIELFVREPLPAVDHGLPVGDQPAIAGDGLAQ